MRKLRKWVAEGTRRPQLRKEKRFPGIYVGFLLPRKIPLATYKGDTCPNCNIRLLETFDRRRGAYGCCPICGWHANIEAEMTNSESEGEAYKALQEKYPTLTIAVKPLSIEDPFQPLKERRESGKEITYDAGGVMSVCFDIKKWVNYDREEFSNAEHAYISIRETEELAKRDGYVIFYMTRDRSLMFARAIDIVQFAKKGYDKQGNYRYDLSREFKQKYVRDRL